MLPRTLIALAIVAAMAPPAIAGPEVPFPLISQRAPEARPGLMIVGVAHFNNPGRDVVNTKVDDVLAPARQTQIEAVAAELAKFHPTHVAVEWPVAKQDRLDARYAAYRAGAYQLSRDETDQLGLRIAAKLNLPRVDAVDWLDEPPGKDEDYDWEVYPTTPEAKARRAAIRDPKSSERITGRLHASTMGGFLYWMNNPEHLAEMNRVYYDYALLGDDQKSPGANWVGSWHMRNLRIFAKLVRLADKPTDRVLVIYGAGHGFLLDEFARQSGAFKVTSPEPLLKAAR